jgi:hypothetical protein
MSRLIENNVNYRALSINATTVHYNVHDRSDIACKGRAGRKSGKRTSLVGFQEFL